MGDRYQLAFHWVILCYMEKYFAQHRRMPSIPHMVKLFQQKRNLDIADRLKVLVARGYLQKNPHYKFGSPKQDAYRFTDKRIDCNMIGHMEYCKFLDSLYDTKWEKEMDDLEIDEWGTTWVGND